MLISLCPGCGREQTSVVRLRYLNSHWSGWHHFNIKTGLFFWSGLSQAFEGFKAAHFSSSSKSLPLSHWPCEHLSEHPQTMVTPMTQRYFGFGELGNSLMYSLCGVEVILGFFFVRWLSRKVADRAVLAAGLVICSVACIWCLIFLCSPQGADLTNIGTCRPFKLLELVCELRAAILSYTLSSVNDIIQAVEQAKIHVGQRLV